MGASPLFVLQPDHPAGRMENAAVAAGPADDVRFQFTRPGHATVVVKATAPLRIVEQHGLTARLQPGWDGSLGYSLYALAVEATAPGAGRVRLAVEPVPEQGTLSPAVWRARSSRFPDNPALFAQWQQAWREKLAGWLMNGGLPARGPLAAEIVETETRPQFTLRRVRYRTRADRVNTLLLALPHHAGRRAPLLVGLHGHEATWGEADAGAFTAGHADDFCAHFAERGWAVLQPATMNHTLQQAGWTLQGEWTWDAMRALDYALTIPELDTGRVAVCGLSTGAHLAMNLLALDDRVRAGVVGCVLSTWHHYRHRMRIPPHCDCGILGQLGDRLEQCDWAALAAPKPVQFQHGRQDAAFCPGADATLVQPGWNTSPMPADEFAALFAELERAWRLTNAADHLELHIHATGHRVDNTAAHRFLGRRLAPVASNE